MNPKKVLITGASGLIGNRLTRLLLENQYEVVHLSRKANEGHPKSYAWDVETGTLDKNAFDGVEAVIHLAGAGVADRRWTVKRKKEILDSRVQSTQLLAEFLKAHNPVVRSFISASAIGYYGFGLTNEVFTEESKPGSDFLAEVVKAWEHEADKIQELGIRTVKLRIGIVLSKEGGALKQIAKPIRWGVGAPLGTGRQYMSWIHIDDLCRMFLFAVENDNLVGTFNAAGVQPVTNKEFTRAVAVVLNKPLLLPPVPDFLLKLLLGEMADLILQGSVVSSAKIQKAGFVFHYPYLAPALTDLLRK